MKRRKKSLLVNMSKFTEGIFDICNGMGYFHDLQVKLEPLTLKLFACGSIIIYLIQVKIERFSSRLSFMNYSPAGSILLLRAVDFLTLMTNRGMIRNQSQLVSM